jgi:hypothetical protein
MGKALILFCDCCPFERYSVVVNSQAHQRLATSGEFLPDGLNVRALKNVDDVNYLLLAMGRFVYRIEHLYGYMCLIAIAIWKVSSLDL